MKTKTIKIKIIALSRKYLTKRFLVGIVLGGVVGYAYYHFIGCNSGSCALTSNPVNSVLYGMLFGGVLFFNERKEKQPGSSQEEGT